MRGLALKGEGRSITLVFALCPGLTARPQLFDFAFLAYMLFAYRDSRKKYLYLIPMVVAIWANMHAAVLGVALSFLYALISYLPPFEHGGIKHCPGDRMLCSVVAGLSLVGSLATPWGPDIYSYVIKTVTDGAFSTIQEWQPPPLITSISWP